MAKILFEAKNKYPTYFSDAEIVYADNTGNNYNVMFKSPSKGYIKTIATISSTGSITFATLNLSGLSDKDFSSCKQFSS